jgi:general secretion pathway protein I
LSRDGAAAGFTLIEALVALALILAFAAAVGPLMFQSRSIMTNSERRVAAQVLLRSLLDAPFDRERPAQSREGETYGLRWQIVGEPVFVPALPPKEGALWAPVRVTVSVSWGRGQVVRAETLRLGRAE